MNQIGIRASALRRQFSSVRALNDLTIEVPAGVRPTYGRRHLCDLRNEL